MVSVKELEEALVVEELTDEEVEMAQEKVCYNAKRGVVAQQEVVVKEDQDEGKGEGGSESEEEEDKPVCQFSLLVKVKGKQPVK